MTEQSESTVDELETKLENLEEKVERNSTGKNRIEVQAYDLRVKADSEDASIEELQDVASEEMEKLQEKALIGEYQELEKQNMFSLMLGGDE